MIAQVIDAKSIFQKRRENNTREKKIEKLNRMNQIFLEVAMYVQETQVDCARLIEELNVLSQDIAALEEEILDGKA